MTKFNDIPEDEHYAIIQREVIHIPEDERSRTHPGHGYPAEDREYMTYQVFPLDKRSEWKDAINKLANRPYVKFRALRVSPAKVTTVFVVNVKVE